mgnify:CR=1 FL=1|jgi:hypothetical protein
MGSFSWNRADDLTTYENIAYGDAFKLLIPKEFAGGFIRDHYQDYGDITDHNTGLSYDLYELLAFWNHEHKIPFENGCNVSDKLEYDGKLPLLKAKDKYTDHNRSIRINIGCYDSQIDKLKYPLKLVSVSYKGSYEDCKKPSYGDPDQGFFKRKRRARPYL